MKTFLIKTILFLQFFLLLPPLYSQTIDKNIYKARRQEVINKMMENSITVFESADLKNRNSDNDFKFKQDATFQYLTGILEPDSYLILLKPGISLGSKEITEILFVREKNPMTEQWTGEILGEEKAAGIAGADTALSSNVFTDIFKKYAINRKVLYLGNNDYTLKKDKVADLKYNFYDDRKKKLKSFYPDLEIKSLFEIIADMREIKSKQELANINKAIDATMCGYIEAMKSCEPNMYEYDLEAIIEYAFKRNGCRDLAFSSIVGSGKNSLVLHYDKNDSKMHAGDLVLMDIGAEYDGYAADLSRTIPINGKFTPEQEEIYSIVLKASDETVKIMVPGTKRNDVEKKALDMVAEGLLKLGIIKDKKEARTYMPHGVSHNFGLDVHDISTSKPLRAGQTVTIEPGIYIPFDNKIDKKYQGIGVRIEDDILITESGNIMLTKKAPRTIDLIEKVMSEKGIGNIEIGNYKK
jgi:Xaa-Pro aminopeptidase